MATRFRKRRRRMVAWLPNLQYTDGSSELNFLLGNIGVDRRSRLLSAQYPLIRDSHIVNSSADTSLGDYTQDGYILQRIVGKLRMAMRLNANQEGQSNYPAIAFVKAGFEILNVHGGAAGSQLPLAQDPIEYNSMRSLNERDPWIWQRSYMFTNNAIANIDTYSDLTQSFWNAGSPGNLLYNATFDGPHIDVKVKRRVGPDQRLFFMLDTWQPDALDEQVGLDGNVDFWLDYRVLGTPTKTSNRRDAAR